MKDYKCPNYGSGISYNSYVFPRGDGYFYSKYGCGWYEAFIMTCGIDNCVPNYDSNLLWKIIR